MTSPDPVAVMARAPRYTAMFVALSVLSSLNAAYVAAMPGAWLQAGAAVFCGLAALRLAMFDASPTYGTGEGR